MSGGRARERPLGRLHRRLVVGMGLAGLVAFAGGAGVQPVSVALASAALVLALLWQPGPETSRWLDRVWLPLALLLVARALYHVVLVRDDVVVPVVDLLLVLLAAESLRSLDAPNDVRLYSLSFALMLAATAYRPGIVFALAFIVYVVLGTLALMVGHLRREAVRHRSADPPLGRPFLVSVAGLSGATLAASLVVFLTFPRVSRSWPGRGSLEATSMAGFSDRVTLGSHGSRILPNPETVLRVEFDSDAPASRGGLYWRGRSYDRFDGLEWHRSGSLPAAVAPPGWYRERWPGRVVQDVYAAPLDVRVLFGLHPVLRMDGQGTIQPLFDNAGDYTYWGSGTPHYRVVSASGTPPPDRLREAGEGPVPGRAHYLQLPPLPDRVHALADSLTRGAENRYDRAVAVRDWLRSSFAYTLDLPPPGRESIDHFLFDRRAGHCEYFSTAMIVLLRSAGIPSREVNGFRGGHWNDFGQYLAVTQNEAHSWVEVWFTGYGWVAFDPTPAGSGGAGAASAWVPGFGFMLDGIQHRWGKWILDYDAGNQVDLLGWARDAVTGGRGSVDLKDPGWLLWVALVLGTPLAVVLVLSGSRGRWPPETRAFVSLRRACRKAGVEGDTGRALLRSLSERAPDAVDPARRVVELYHRGRFGNARLSERALTEMEESVRQARDVVRRASRGPSPGRGRG